jgi:sigma-B regulation protein RsbU (phosphoserine phosphatase)
MFKSVRKNVAARIVRPRGSAPSTKLKRNTVRFFWLMLGGWILGNIVPGGFGWFLRFMGWMFAIGLVICLTGLFFRWLFSRVLWTVRSRLIVTCLLLGMAPIVLFDTLAAIAAYAFCGQFATSIAMESIKDGLERVQERSEGAATFIAHMTPGVLDGPATANAVHLRDFEENESPVRLSGWRDGKQIILDVPPPKEVRTPSPFAGDAPAWLHPGFKGVVVAANMLFLCADSGNSVGGHSLQVLACSPLRDREVSAIAEGLGSVRIATNLDLGVSDSDEDGKDENLHTNDNSTKASHVSGGLLAPAINFFDVRVFFSAPLDATDWTTGEGDPSWLFVTSRPSVLYRRLFASSLRFGLYVKLALISVSVMFALLELLACLMAFALSRTITRSIADLYEATQAIDRGNLEHRIPVRRKDQLGTLATSFNTMTASLQGLLAEQREKDRMQNELKIAQAVQKNLFPHTEIDIPNFEVFGLCEPAQTIGGDYYDFIPFGASQLYLALGDISGKGISAALLMASLHSAVRAYQTGDSLEANEPRSVLGEDLCVSPGRMLALLNQHLYSSTQPEKYATLFLACYDNDTHLLTYSNGGHLPPVVLRKDGSVKRLDCGGSVVGLLEGMAYNEETVHLDPGDLLVAYSDGLTEPERDGEDFGESRLIATIKRNQILNLPDIAAHTIAAVKTWIGDEEQPDDMTLVLARPN